MKTDMRAERSTREGLRREVGQSFYLLALTALISGVSLSAGLAAVWALG